MRVHAGLSEGGAELETVYCKRERRWYPPEAWLAYGGGLVHNVSPLHWENGHPLDITLHETVTKIDNTLFVFKLP